MRYKIQSGLLRPLQQQQLQQQQMIKPDHQGLDLHPRHHHSPVNSMHQFKRYSFHHQKQNVFFFQTKLPPITDCFEAIKH